MMACNLELLAKINPFSLKDTAIKTLQSKGINIRTTNMNEMKEKIENYFHTYVQLFFNDYRKYLIKQEEYFQ